MSAERKSLSIKARIEALEKELAAKLQQIADIEASIAQAYEDGTSPAAMVKQLSALRDEVAGGVSALRSLDKRYYEVALQEFSDGLAAVRRATEGKFKACIQDIETHLAAVDMATHGLDATDLDPFRRDLRSSLWDCYLRRSVAEQQAVGRPPREPWPRDDLGRQIDPAATGPSASQFRITGAEAAQREAMAQFNSPGTGVFEVRGQ